MRLVFIILTMLFLTNTVSATSVSKLLNRATSLQESNPDSCIYLSQQVLTVIDDEQLNEKGNSYWNLAQAYLYKHQYHTALFFALKGKDLYRNKDTAHVHQRLLATIGWVYYDIGNYHHAAPYHAEAMEIAQLRQDTPNEVRYTNALGLSALGANQYQKALSYFQKALLLLDNGKNEYAAIRSSVQNNMGIVYINYEDWIKAEEFLLESVKNSSGNASGLLETYSLLSKVYLHTSQYDKCKKFLLMADDLSYQTTYSFSLIEYYKVRSDYEKALGNYRVAYRYLSKYIQRYNQVNNKEVQDVMR